MKVYILFFITFTLMQLLFTSCYFLLVGKVNLTMVTGTAIYFTGMLRAYVAYQEQKYQQKKRELLDSLPS